MYEWIIYTFSILKDPVKKKKNKIRLKADSFTRVDKMGHKFTTRLGSGDVENWLTLHSNTLPLSAYDHNQRHNLNRQMQLDERIKITK